jgi:hypothetical protein
VSDTFWEVGMRRHYKVIHMSLDLGMPYCEEVSDLYSKTTHNSASHGLTAQNAHFSTPMQSCFVMLRRISSVSMIKSIRKHF